MIIISYQLITYIQQGIYQTIQNCNFKGKFQFITQGPKFKYKTNCKKDVCYSFKKIKIKANVYDNYFVGYPFLYTPGQNFLVLYIHGQNELFSNKKYMSKLKIWSGILNKNGNILVAPNLFANNIDSPLSFEEINLTIQKLRVMFPNMKIYLLAFSRGGIIAYKIIADKELIKQFDKIIVLAGVLPYNILTSTTCINIREYPDKIKIYHGNLDINVPIKLSTNVLMNFCKNKGYDIDKTTKYLEGYDHWKLGYTKNLYKFLNY